MILWLPPWMARASSRACQQGLPVTRTSRTPCRSSRHRVVRPGVRAGRALQASGRIEFHRRQEGDGDLGKPALAQLAAQAREGARIVRHRCAPAATLRVGHLGDGARAFVDLHQACRSTVMRPSGKITTRRPFFTASTRVRSAIGIARVDGQRDRTARRRASPTSALPCGS